MCDGTTAPADRSTQRSVNYVRTDLELVAAGWADLTDGTIHHPINRDENGDTFACGSGCLPWTNVKTDGTCRNGSICISGNRHCNGWTYGGGLCGTADGRKGDVSRTDFGWTDGSSGLCSSPAEKHYCIEQ